MQCLFCSYYCPINCLRFVLHSYYRSTKNLLFAALLTLCLHNPQQVITEMGKNNKSKNKATKDSHRSSSEEKKVKSSSGHSKHGRKEKRNQPFEENSLPSPSDHLVDDCKYYYFLLVPELSFLLSTV